MTKENKRGILVTDKYSFLRLEEFYKAVIKFKGQYTLEEIIDFCNNNTKYKSKRYIFVRT